MSAEQGKPPSAVDAKGTNDPEKIRDDIEQTRDEATTKVRELGDKAKEMAPDSAGEGMQQIQRIAHENPRTMALAGTFLAGFLLGRLFSR